MSVVISQKTVDIVVTGDGKKASGRIRKKDSRNDEPLSEGTKALRLHFSLLGETEPALSPLQTGYTFDERSPAYRFDWIVGVAPLEAGGKWWDWLAEIRENRALAVQLLIDGGDSGCTVSEFSANLLGLQPSRDLASWLERNADMVGKSLHEAADKASPMSTRAANILNASALMSNFIGSGERGAKHWFIYRCLDEKRKCAVVEWNIHRTVLEQYGPLLRGSLVLSFHGTWNRPKPITLLLRPRLGFSRASEIDYLPPEEELEGENPVALNIQPGKADPSLLAPRNSEPQ
jgi:hypothetical protein